MKERKLYRNLICIFILILLTGASEPSGLTGQLLSAPGCANVRDEKCRDRGVQANIIARDARGTVVRTVKSDGEGRFILLLPPGVYTLTPENPIHIPRIQSYSVTVTPNGMVSMTIYVVERTRK